ncbi:MAG: type II toxin-antitoxin system VapC family toxin [Vicinamibacterales bacterium]
MTFLLDTHCWLWLKTDASRLATPVRRRLLRSSGELVLSSVCVLEMVVKQASGKLSLGSGGTDRFVADLIEDGVAVLDATVEHMLAMGGLPPRHRDPFDRLLVAQAMVEGLTLVSADPQVLGYDAKTLDARK